jgi:bacillithiol biosynthesis deacetylase BshB1
MTHAEKKVDVLAIGAHPDDVEICCGGTVCLLVEQGYTVGVVDLTRGELGTRGSVEQRRLEAERAAEIMGVGTRINLALADGRIENSREHQLALIRVIRDLRPDIALIGAPEDRHPDHGDATRLCISALFYSGLVKIETESEGRPQEPWRPSHTLHYMQGISFEPDLVVDVSSVWERRMEAVKAYMSQVHHTEYKDDSDEPETFISDPGFVTYIKSRAQALGYRTGARYGEGFLYRHGPIGVDDLVAVLGKNRRA